MDGNSYRDDDDGGVDQPDAYWRRRVITLALGLGLLGILAWGFSGGGGKPRQASPSGALPATALGTAVPGLAAGSPSGTALGTSSGGAAAAGTSRVPGMSPSATPLPGTQPSGTARPSARPAASGATTPSGGAGPAPGERCAPGAVVLSLFTDQASYGPSQYPHFVIYAVSTSAGRCAFDPGQLQVVVLSAGRIVWDSADCDQGGGRVVQLTRGVPAQDAVTWNRAITLPGCQVLAPSARPGTYTVQARTATVQSPVRDFKLSG